MKISEALFRKYISGTCTDEEKRFIEQWMESEDDVPSTLTNTHISDMKERTWEKIEKTNRYSFKKADGVFRKRQNLESADLEKSSKGPLSLVLYRRFARISVAACFAALFFGAGYLTSNGNVLTEKQNPPGVVKNELHVITVAGKTAKLKGERYALSYQGTIGLYGVSEKPIVIECGDKEFLLQPGTRYNLVGSDENPVIFNEQETMVYGGSDPKLNGRFTIREISIFN